MFKRTQLYQALAAALLLLSGAGNLAFAAVNETETEPDGTIGRNDTIQQVLQQRRLDFTAADCPPPPAPVVPGQTCVVVNGVLGTTAPLPANLADVDFYWFEAYAGNILNVDIDFGMKRSAPNQRSVDTTIALFGPLPSVTKVREGINMDRLLPPDEGSEDFRDALIENFRVRTDGVYVVGVSSQPRFFLDGGAVSSTTLGTFSNGAYTLKITGVIPPIVQVNIDIKPGNPGDVPVNPKSKGVIPVAILSSEAKGSSPKFDALTINHYSMTFGKTGDEKSYVGCLKHGVDVDADGVPDLVCHFDNQAANWDVDDVEGILRGQTTDGTKFEGRGRLKIVPKQRD